MIYIIYSGTPYERNYVMKVHYHPPIIDNQATPEDARKALVEHCNTSLRAKNTIIVCKWSIFAMLLAFYVVVGAAIESMQYPVFDPIWYLYLVLTILATIGIAVWGWVKYHRIHIDHEEYEARLSYKEQVIAMTCFKGQIVPHKLPDDLKSKSFTAKLAGAGDNPDVLFKVSFGSPLVTINVEGPLDAVQGILNRPAMTEAIARDADRIIRVRQPQSNSRIR